jgi:hypothetical protein
LSVSAAKEIIMSNKHLRPDETPVDLQDDHERNPGIGQSSGLFARTSGKDANLIDGDNTVEGDSGNDVGVAGGVDPERGRDH